MTSFQSPTPSGQPILPAELSPEPPRDRSSRRWIAIAAGLIGLGAVGYFALSGGDTPKGAGSPEEAVQGLVVALDSDDALGAMTFIAPDEVDGVSAVLEAVQAKAAESGLGRLTAGGDTNLQLDIGTVQVDPLSDHAARVEVDFGGSFTASGTLGQLVGTSTNEFDDTEVRLIAIELDGGWFVSPLLSLGDYLVDEFDLPNGDYDEVGAARAATTGGKTPTDAVESLVDGVAEFDLEAVSDSLASGEARFVTVFERAIDELVGRGEQEMAENGISIELLDLGLAEQGQGAVGMMDAEIGFSDFNGSGKVEIDEDCFTTANEFGDRNTGCLLMNAPLSEPLPSSNLVFLTAEQSGAHRVQLLKSAASLVGQIAKRLDKATVLQELDLEFLDAATPATYGEPTSATFDGEQYQVFEIDVPAGEPFTLSARTDDDEYVGYDAYVLEDGQWSYFDSELSEDGLDEATKARIVVYAECDNYDSDAVLFGCEDYSKTPFVVTAQPSITDVATFLETSSFTLQPGQRASFTFDVTTQTDAMVTVMTAGGDADYVDISGPYEFNTDNSYRFVPGEYTVTFTNRTASAEDFTLEFEQVEVVDLLMPYDISISSPSTTFDLSDGAGVQFGAYADIGESVAITATPEEGQDIVLVVMAGTSEICGPSRNGDLSGTGGTESCSFDVRSGGRFDVSVTAYGVGAADGLVTVELFIS